MNTGIAHLPSVRHLIPSSLSSRAATSSGRPTITSALLVRKAATGIVPAKGPNACSARKLPRRGLHVPRAVSKGVEAGHFTSPVSLR